MPEVAEEERRSKMLTPEEAETYEARLENDPGNLKIRRELLEYYMMRAFRSDEALKEQARHIFWIIENAPGADVAGSPCAHLMDRPQDKTFAEESRRLWREQVKARPDDATVLGHAAFGLFAPGPEKQDEVFELLEKAESLAPNDYRWPEKLGQLHSLERYTKDAGAKAAAGKKAVAAYERAYKLLYEPPAEPMKELKKSILLQDLAINALVAEEDAKAEDYATRLLAFASKSEVAEVATDWNDGNILHWGHIISGKVALRRGDLEAAKTHLLAAGETEGSPQLNSFGPDMALAKSLLNIGERETARAYFEACLKFWGMGAERLQTWIAAVEQGQEPDFRESYCKID